MLCDIYHRVGVLLSDLEENFPLGLNHISYSSQEKTYFSTCIHMFLMRSKQLTTSCSHFNMSEIEMHLVGGALLLSAKQWALSAPMKT